jgi:DNA-directed RNA polymerase I, II, and III subunit RPABC2
MSVQSDSDNEGDFEGEFEEDELEFVSLDLPGIKPELRKLYAVHPELIVDYIETVLQKVSLKSVQPSGRDPSDVNYDENHKTYPFLTLYERTKIIGLRANQLSQGARPFVSIPAHVTDVREIARMELAQKKLPYIVKRPLPNGTFEYWRLSDLMLL